MLGTNVDQQQLPFLIIGIAFIVAVVVIVGFRYFMRLSASESEKRKRFKDKLES